LLLDDSMGASARDEMEQVGAASSAAVDTTQQDRGEHRQKKVVVPRAGHRSVHV